MLLISIIESLSNFHENDTNDIRIKLQHDVTAEKYVHGQMIFRDI